MSGIEQRSGGKESLPEILIERYIDTDKDAIIAGMSDIQEVERSLSDTRRPGGEVSEEYFVHVVNEVAEKSGAIFMAHSEGKVVGFIACYIQTDGEIIQTPESDTYGYISDAWVSPELRGRGLFAKLNTQVEEHFKQFPEINFIRMSVVAGNNQALQAYENNGYKPEIITLSKKIKTAPPTSES